MSIIFGDSGENEQIFSDFMILIHGLYNRPKMVAVLRMSTASGLGFNLDRR